MTRRALGAVVFMVMASFAAVPVAAQATVDVCGTLGAFEAPTDVQPIGRLQINVGSQALAYKVDRHGTVSPPDIAGRGTALNPVRLRFSGTMSGDVVTSYTITMVTTCGLPGTAASPESIGAPPLATPTEGSGERTFTGTAAFVMAAALVTLIAVRRVFARP